MERKKNEKLYTCAPSVHPFPKSIVNEGSFSKEEGLGAPCGSAETQQNQR